MLTKKDFKKVTGGVRIHFVIYFHQSHGWIWFKIVLWKSKESTYKYRTLLQKNPNVLTAETVAKTCSVEKSEACNFIEIEPLAQVFACESCKISKNTFSYRTPPVAASVTVILSWMAGDRYQFHTKQSRVLLMLILVHIFLWVTDTNETWRCSNGIFKQKLSEQKREDFMRVKIYTILNPKNVNFCKFFKK